MRKGEKLKRRWKDYEERRRELKRELQSVNKRQRRNEKSECVWVLVKEVV